MNIILNGFRRIDGRMFIKSLVLSMALMAALSVDPAHADNRGGDTRSGGDERNQQEHGQDHDRHPHPRHAHFRHPGSDRDWKRHEMHARGTYDPGVVYAPPAVIEYPQSDSNDAPGINLIIPLNIN